MNNLEMEGFLRGKCLPGDIKVNETNAEYLVRKIAGLEAQVKQLAAENAALKLWASQSVELWDAGCDMDGHMRDVPQSVSTDAILASLRAEGVEMAIEAAKPEVASEFQRETFDQCVTAAVKYPQSDLAGKVEMVAWLEWFAAQLRSKSEVQS